MLAVEILKTPTLGIWFAGGTQMLPTVTVSFGKFKQTATAKQFASSQHPSPHIARVQVLTCQRYPEVVDLCSDLFWCASWTEHDQT